jgi:non-ribosomal peptide synthetase component F
MSQTTCLHVTGGGPQDSRQVEPVSPVSLSELVLVDQHAPQGARVRQDERLDRLFEERCDWLLKHGRAGQLAVDCDEQSLTYPELDAKANRLARYLRLHGVDAGDRIALLFDRPTDSYVAMLAVLKIGAAYVALDASFPTERMAYVVSDYRGRLATASKDGVRRV